MQRHGFGAWDQCTKDRQGPRFEVLVIPYHHHNFSLLQCSFTFTLCSHTLAPLCCGIGRALLVRVSKRPEQLALVNRILEASSAPSHLFLSRVTFVYSSVVQSVSCVPDSRSSDTMILFTRSCARACIWLCFSFLWLFATELSIVGYVCGFTGGSISTCWSGGTDMSVTCQAQSRWDSWDVGTSS